MKKIRRITALCLLAAFTVIAFAGCGAANDVPENPIICVSLNYGENSSTPSGNAGSQTPSGNQNGSQTPSSTTPSASTPDASTPSAETPDASTPSAETPDASTPSDNGGSASNKKSPGFIRGFYFLPHTSGFEGPVPVAVRPNL